MKHFTTLLGLLLCAIGTPTRAADNATAPPAPARPNISIVEAAAKGDLDRVQAHLAAGTEINDRDGDHDSTALHAAAFHGELEIVKYLIEQGAEINAKNRHGQTPRDVAWEDIENKDRFSDADRTAKRQVGEYLAAQGAEHGPERKGFPWWILGPAIPLTILLLFIIGIIYAIKTKPVETAQQGPTQKFIVVTSPTIPGKKIVRVLGLVRGNTIRARHVGKDIVAGLRNVVGGEVSEYAKLLAESREQAIDRMLVEAEGLGANAVISVNFQTSVIMGGAAEMMAYGTAVVVEDE